MAIIKVPYINFTGDYAELKNCGFKFQKLYATNYMQWSLEEFHLRVWKVGHEITRDGDSDLGQLFEFHNTKPEISVMDGWRGRVNIIPSTNIMLVVLTVMYLNP